MKKLNTKIAALVLGGSFIMSSCTAVQNANNTQKGAGIGAVAGGVIGGILGNNLGKGGNTALGAVIGAAVGGAAGGVIGNKMDKQAQKIEEVLPGAEVVRTEEGINLILDENSRVTFEYNKDGLTPTAKANLDKLVEVLWENHDGKYTKSFSFLDLKTTKWNAITKIFMFSTWSFDKTLSVFCYKELLKPVNFK